MEGEQKDARTSQYEYEYEYELWKQASGIHNIRRYRCALGTEMCSVHSQLLDWTERSSNGGTFLESGIYQRTNSNSV